MNVQPQDNQIVRKNLLAQPINIPATQTDPMPFLLRFVEAPEGGMIPPGQTGNNTYMGTTSCAGGEQGDFKNDDE